MRVDRFHNPLERWASTRRWTGRPRRSLQPTPTESGTQPLHLAEEALNRSLLSVEITELLNEVEFKCMHTNSNGN
jgi:hypothetical protein